jgi:hypothetical protein
LLLLLVVLLAVVAVGGCCCWRLLQPFSCIENGKQSAKQQMAVVDNNFGSLLLPGGKLQTSEGEVPFSLRQCV